MTNFLKMRHKHSVALLAFLLFQLICRGAIAAPSLRVACVGDSITAGYAVKSEDSYPTQLRSMVGNEFQQIRNFGISGTTLLKKGDSTYWNPNFLEAITDFQPHIVLLMLGTNDSKPQNWVHRDEFQTDYSALVTRFRELRSRPTIIAMLPIPGVGEGAFQIPPAVLASDIVPAVRAAAAANNLPFIDTNTPFIGHPELIADNIHPTPAGYKLIAELVANGLKQLPRFSAVSEPFLTSAEAAIEVPVSEGKDAFEVRYTLDGTLPTAKSPRYSKPIVVKSTTVITAAVFEDGKPGLASTLTLTKEPPHPAMPVAVTVPGLSYQLYQGLPGKIWRIGWDENLKVGEGAVSGLSLEPRKQDEWYAFTFSGRINAPTTGMYRFFLNARQGSRLLIDNGLVVQTADYPGEYSGLVALAAGSHDFLLHYFNASGAGHLKLDWEGPELVRAPVSDSSFSRVVTP